MLFGVLLFSCNYTECREIKKSSVLDLDEKVNIGLLQVRAIGTTACSFVTQVEQAEIILWKYSEHRTDYTEKMLEKESIGLGLFRASVQKA